MIPFSSTPSEAAAAAEAQEWGEPGSPAGPVKNPAGAYLDQFKTIVDLIERLPDRPELIGDLLNWRPASFDDYFASAALPGRASAADVCASLNRYSKNRFEGIVSDLDCKATGAAAAIRRHYKTHGEARPDIMLAICGRAGKNLREALGKANSLAKYAQGTGSGAGVEHGCGAT
ncbi:MAG: hypothetical protein J2P49_06945 [Methylocapsa sp.]|nr:hypothetical protein [Methylocapsa sp.]